MSTKHKEFITPDLHPCCAISILLNLELTFKVEDGRTLFCFPVSDDLYNAMTAYYNGIPLNAYLYAEKIKSMRGEMSVRRGER